MIKTFANYSPQDLRQQALLVYVCSTGFLPKQFNQRTAYSRVLLQKLPQFLNYSINCPQFMKTEGSSQCLQKLACSYQKSVEYITHALPSHLRSILILSSNLRRFPSGVVLQVSPTKPCLYLSYPPVRVICPRPAHLSLNQTPTTVCLQKYSCLFLLFKAC